MRASRYLIDLGYETDKTFKGFGERMKRVNGVTIILFYKLPFRTSRYTAKKISGVCFYDLYFYIALTSFPIL